MTSTDAPTPPAPETLHYESPRTEKGGAVSPWGRAFKGIIWLVLPCTAVAVGSGWLAHYVHGFGDEAGTGVIWSGIAIGIVAAIFTRLIRYEIAALALVGLLGAGIAFAVDKVLYETAVARFATAQEKEMLRMQDFRQSADRGGASASTILSRNFDDHDRERLKAEPHRYYDGYILSRYSADQKGYAGFIQTNLAVPGTLGAAQGILAALTAIAMLQIAGRKRPTRRSERSAAPV